MSNMTAGKSTHGANVELPCPVLSEHDLTRMSDRTEEPRRAWGLTSKEATRRLAEEGRNELPTGRTPRLVAIAWGVVAEPMFLLLIGAIGIYLVLGDVREALILAASLLVVVAIAIYQQRRTERALEALRDLSSPRALVIRD